MREIKKLKCNNCNAEFIPRTFHEVIPLYPYPGRYQIFYYTDHFKDEKPYEVIVKQWVTYCTECKYIVKFIKQIAKLVKNFRNPNNVELKYETEDFEKPCPIYPEYLEDLISELQKRIESHFYEIKMFSWLDLLTQDANQGDHFKFLVRFIAKIESYYESQFGLQKEKDMPIKVKDLKLAKDLEENLIHMNTLRNDVVHHEYELTENDHKEILDSYSKFILYLLEKFIKPEISKIISESGYNFIDLKDLNQELYIYLKSLFHEKYLSNMDLLNRMLDSLLIKQV